MKTRRKPTAQRHRKFPGERTMKKLAAQVVKLGLGAGLDCGETKENTR